MGAAGRRDSKVALGGAAALLMVVIMALAWGDDSLSASARLDPREQITLTAEQAQTADVDGSGDVSAFDAALIARRAVDAIHLFPVER